MCVVVPVAMAYMAVIASVASTAMSVYSAKQQADAQQEQADYQAAVARNNAQIAENNAKSSEVYALDAQDRASSEAAAQESKTKRLIAQQTASTAASGLLTDTGTPLDIVAQSAQYGAIDAANIRTNGEREANGFLSDAYNMRAKGTDFTAQSGLLKMQGQQAQTAGTLSMIGSGIKGAGSVASAYYSGYSKNKAGDMTWGGK